MTLISVLTKNGMTLGFLTLISPGWVVTFLDGIYIWQLVTSARCCTSVLISILKIFKSLQNYWHRVITSYENICRVLGHTLNFCPYGGITFQEYDSIGISHLVFYGYLVYKLRRIKDAATSISADSKKRIALKRRQYDQVITERTIGVVLGPFYSHTHTFTTLHSG